MVQQRKVMTMPNKLTTIKRIRKLLNQMEKDMLSKSHKERKDNISVECYNCLKKCKDCIKECNPICDKQ